jgi:zinc protease
MLALSINKRSLNVQRKVVVEEFKETTLNEPYGDVWHHIGDMVYKEHPYRWPVIGLVPQHIEDAELTDVKDFFNTFYVPNNAILSIVGNFSKIKEINSDGDEPKSDIQNPKYTEGVKRMAEKWFSNIPAGDVPKRNLPQEPPQTEQIRRTLEASVPLDALYMTFRVPARTHPDYYAIDLLTDVLASGGSSRFFRKLLKEKRLFSEIDCAQTGYLDPGLIIIDGKPTEGVTLEQAEAVIWEELELLQNELIDEQELQKLKNRIESQQVSCAESNLAGLLVRHMLKVLNARGFVKEVAHLSKAFACRRTSSAGIRLDNP